MRYFRLHLRTRSWNNLKCYAWLFLASPADCCTTDLEHMSWCRFTIIHVSSPVSITVSSTVTWSIFPFKESQEQKPLQVVHNPLTAVQCCLEGLAQNLATLLTAYVISGLVVIDRYSRLNQLPIETGLDQHSHSPQLSSQVSSLHLLVCGLAWHSPFQISAGLFGHKLLDRSTLLQSVGSESP